MITRKFWPITCNNWSRKLAIIYSKHPRKSSHNPWNNQPKIARIWTITDSFPEFYPRFQFRTNMRQLNICFCLHQANEISGEFCLGPLVLTFKGEPLEEILSSLYLSGAWVWSLEILLQHCHHEVFQAEDKANTQTHRITKKWSWSD